MTNKKSTKRALLSSVLSLLLCCSMLIGTTFAWFTDEVKSASNIITAGNLDVEVVNKDDMSIKDVKLFDGILWEPGVVAYENITVKNVGTLALKYALYVNFENQNFVVDANGKQTQYGLASALKVAIVENGVNTSLNRDNLVASITDWTSLQELVETDVLYPVDQDATTADIKTYGIVIYWQPGENDNNWNVNNGKTTTDGKPLHIDLGINLLATQLMYENDSYGPDYDEDAKFDALPQASVTEMFCEEWSTYLIKDIINGGIGSGVMTQLTLDTAYSFKGEPVETAEQNEYADWYVDFFVSLDKAPEEGLVLSGQYSSWDPDNWYAFYIPTGMVEAGEFYPLLGTVTGGGVSNWTYTEICSGVGTFNCGAVDMNGLNEGTTMTVELRLINPENTDETIVVKSVQYTFGHKPYTVSNSDELAAAIEAGYYDLWLNDGTYQMPAVAKGKTLTISGSQNAVIAHENQGEDGMNYSLEGSTVVFNGVTIKTTSGTYRGFARSNEITYNGCYFEGSYTLGAGSHTFNDCYFNLKNNYVWTWGGTNVVFDGCTFEDENGVGKAILVHNTVNTEVTIKDCTFIATTGANTWDGIHVAAVSIDPNGAHTVKVTFEGTNNVSSAFAGNWQVKYAEEASLVTVVE